METTGRLQKTETARGEAHARASLAPSPLYAWYVVGLLALINVFNYLDRMAFAVLMPAITEEIPLSDSQMGLLVGIAFSLFCGVAALPIARWADAGKRRQIIVLTLTLWSVITALTGAAQNFLQLFLARAGVGIGEAGGTPAAHSALCDHFPPRQRSSVISLHTLGGAVGGALGLALVGSLAESIGWRWTFVALGIPGVLVALITLCTFKEPLRGRFDTVDDQQARPSFAQALRSLWRSPTSRLVILALTLGLFAYNGLTQWWPTFYARAHQMPLSDIGLYLGVSSGLGAGIGLVGGGLAANQLAKRDNRLPLLLSAGAVAACMPVSLIAVMSPNAMLSFASVFFLNAFHSVSIGPVFATLYNATPPHMRATTTAVAMLVANATAGGTGPFVVGLLSDVLRTNFGDYSLQYALLVPALAYPIMAIVLFNVMRTLDHERT